MLPRLWTVLIVIPRKRSIVRPRVRVTPDVARVQRHRQASVRKVSGQRTEPELDKLHGKRFLPIRWPIASRRTYPGLERKRADGRNATGGKRFEGRQESNLCTCSRLIRMVCSRMTHATFSVQGGFVNEPRYVQYERSDGIAESKSTGASRMMLRTNTLSVISKPNL